MKIETAIIQLKRLAFPVCALALWFATTNGFVALLHVGSSDTFGWLQAAGLAGILDAVLVSSIIDWQKKHSLFALIAMLIFFAVSSAFSVNFWFRQIHGSTQTTEIFDVQREAAVRQLTIVHDRIKEASTALLALSEYSKKKAQQEVEKGDTCEKKTPEKEGPRQRFRKRDADFFEGLQRDLSAIPLRLADKIEIARNLNPIPGQTLAADLKRLGAAVDAAISIQADPALLLAKDKLAARVDEDARDRKDGANIFNCSDASIRNQAGATVARLDKALSLKIPAIDVHDMTDPSEGLRILTLILDYQNWGKKGGLSAAGAGVIFIALILDLALYTSARAFSENLRSERVLDRLAADLDHIPDVALEFIKALADEPDPVIRQFFRILSRYQRRILAHPRLIVSYGCSDPDAASLEWWVPKMKKVGWIEADHWLLAPPDLAINWIAWRNWRETRGCDRRESFRIKEDAFDELHLAEVVARMRANRRSAPEPHQDNWPPRLQAAE